MNTYTIVCIFIIFHVFLISCTQTPYVDDQDYWPEDEDKEALQESTWSPPYMGDHDELVNISIDELNTYLMQSKPIDVEELINNAEELQQFYLDIQINHHAAKVIEINGNKFYARAFSINTPNVKKITVESFIIPAQTGPDYIFIPALTVYESDYDVISEIQPNKNYSVNGGILKLEFEIPDNANYFVIHTKQEYINSSPIAGKEGGVSHSNDYKKADTSFMAYSIFGGVLGAFMQPALEKSMANGNKMHLKEFYYAHGGIVTIHASK